MTTLYVPGTAGPWYCDDDIIRCDGIYATGLYIEGVAHVDGIGGAVKRRKRPQGLTRARRNDTPMRGRDRR